MKIPLPNNRATAAILALLSASAAIPADTRMQDRVISIAEAQFSPPNTKFGVALSGATLWTDPVTGRQSYLIRWAKGSTKRHYHKFDYQGVVLKGKMTHQNEAVPDSGAKILEVGSVWFQTAGKPHVDSCLSDECLSISTTFGTGETVFVPDAK